MIEAHGLIKQYGEKTAAATVLKRHATRKHTTVVCPNRRGRPLGLSGSGPGHRPGPGRSPGRVDISAGHPRRDAGQRDVEQPPAVTGERGGGRRGRDDAGHRVGDRVGTEPRLAVLPRHQSPGDRRIVAEPDTIAARAGATVGGDRRPHLRSAVIDEVPCVDTELFQGPRARPFDDDIGGRQQLAELLNTARRPKVDRDAAVAGVEQVVEPRRTAPGPVGTVHALDLDDPGPLEPKQMGAQRPGPQRRQVDDQWLRRLLP